MYVYLFFFYKNGFCCTEAKKTKTKHFLDAVLTFFYNDRESVEADKTQGVL